MRPLRSGNAQRRPFSRAARPRRQVFGRKDYQQFKLLCRMVRDLDIGVRMIGAPLVREADGLALSSRNVRLKPEERTRALAISAALRAAAAAAAAGKRNAAALRSDVVSAITAAGGDVDYVEARFGAAHQLNARSG